MIRKEFEYVNEKTQQACALDMPMSCVLCPMCTLCSVCDLCPMPCAQCPGLRHICVVGCVACVAVWPCVSRLCGQVREAQAAPEGQPGGHTLVPPAHDPS